MTVDGSPAAAAAAQTSSPAEMGAEGESNSPISDKDKANDETEEECQDDPPEKETTNLEKCLADSDTMTGDCDSRADDGGFDSIVPTCDRTKTSSKDDEPTSVPTKFYRPVSSSLPTSIVDDFQFEGIPTAIILQLFSDRIFISVTQLTGKMGTLIHCSVEESIIDNSTTYHINTLIGSGVARGSTNTAEQECAFREVFVRRLAEQIVKHQRVMSGLKEDTVVGSEDGPIPSLVVGLGLKPIKGGGRMSIACFNSIVDAAMEVYQKGCRVAAAGSLTGLESPD
ncbi:hypothetical protein THAOC_20174 [Thalassiosira oceanica]|uniref:Proteasome assembly chaperone 3 n=1 Tax=Thalassiosira oceanica TaxID=159749 RepID=K0S412_THAOC|nr:hypothetical protein THAOC_20174 [Thalassiosira oceanica]|mmetsp:Transcript_12724/g.30085  ORF Transcript_12724/g.30085 Transcript_12724/m.30085 type:complete len:283 (+) Transcript_12724:129-977(+)|eukprot:EJK59579.1 hypothetical protein THAOC_20174 [Thalassiosira oceanica]